MDPDLMSPKELAERERIFAASNENLVAWYGNSCLARARDGSTVFVVRQIERELLRRLNSEQTEKGALNNGENQN